MQWLLAHPLPSTGMGLAANLMMQQQNGTLIGKDARTITKENAVKHA